VPAAMTTSTLPKATRMSMLPIAFAAAFAACAVGLAAVVVAAAHGSLACPAEVGGLVNGVAAGVEVVLDRLLHGDLRGAFEAVA
jgi:hypothetical protein